MGKIIYIIIILFINIALCQTGLHGIKFPTKVLDEKENSDNEKINLGGGSSDHKAVVSQEPMPVDITRQIIYPRREDGYFINSDVIVVLVKVTALKKEGVENLEIWEIPGNGLEIINCSYPLKTTWVERKLDYEKYEKSFLREEDITRFADIVSLLKNHDKPIYAHLYKLLSNDSRDLLKNSSETSILKLRILNDFNRIIYSSNLYSNISKFTESDIDYRRKIVFHCDENSPYEDHKLVNRRLLEDAFPGVINRTSSSLYKEHETLPINKNIHAIRYDEEHLDSQESIVFKYYLNATKLGKTDIRSIIRCTGFYKENLTPIKIIERDPKFEYELWCESKDIYINSPCKFKYTIKYLGGDDEEKNFTVKVTAHNSCKILSIETRDGDEASKDNVSLNLNLSRGLTKEIIIIASYSQIGLKLSPPIISINNREKEVEADISVYYWPVYLAKMNYEFASIILGIASIIFGIAVIIETILLIFQHLDRIKDKEQSRVIFANLEKDKDIVQGLLKSNTKALENLAELIDKKIK